MRRAAWTTRAQADVARLDDYFASRDPDYADRVGRLAIKAADFLAEFPFAGEQVSPDHRRWHVARTSYLLIYRVLPDSVEILRVRNEREHWRDGPF